MRYKRSIFPNHLATKLDLILDATTFPDIQIVSSGIVTTDPDFKVLSLSSVLPGFNGFLKVVYGTLANNYQTTLLISYTNILANFVEIGQLYSRKTCYVTIYSELVGSFSNLHIVFTAGDFSSKHAVVIQQVNDIDEPVLLNRPKYKILNIDLPAFPFTITSGANGESYPDANNDVTHFLTYVSPYMVVQPEFLTGIAKVLPNDTVYSDVQFDETIGAGSPLREEVILQNKPYLIAI